MTDNDPFAGIPGAVSSRHRTSTVNEAVVLYEGKAIINETDGPTERDVVIVHEWIPRPVIVCRYSTAGSHVFHGDTRLLNEPVTIEIPSLDATVTAYHYDGYSSGEEHQHGLVVHGQVEIGAGTIMSRVIFHVIDCHDFSEGTIRHGSGYSGTGRIDLVSADWRIRIDRTEDSPGLLTSLEQTGGRALTHRVEITRVDGTHFDSRISGHLTA